MKDLRVLFLLCLLPLLWSCGSLEEEEACDAAIKSSGYLTSNDCRTLSWGTALPIRLYYGSSLSTDAVQAYDQAIQLWEGATGKNLFEVSGMISDVGAENNVMINTLGMRSGSQWTSEPIKGQADEPAKTIYYYKNFMYNADIYLNSDFSFSLHGESHSYDLISIALHELGHVLGLDHDDSTSPQISVMNSQIYKGILRRNLSERDIERVKKMYP